MLLERTALLDQLAEIVASNMPGHGPGDGVEAPEAEEEDESEEDESEEQPS